MIARQNMSAIEVSECHDIQMRAYAGGHHERCGVLSIVSGNAPQHLWCGGVLGMSEARQTIGATGQ